MRKYPHISLATLLAIATAIPILSNAHAAIAQNITQKSDLAKERSGGLEILVVNSSGVGLKSLQVAPGNSLTWGSNILSADMTNGEERQVQIAKQRRDCYRDIKAVFANGSSIEDCNINFCRNDIYTFTTTTLSVPALW
ncbi:hypothetical protein [Pseudanabaena sp. PCC 6802]|uniref:hypothetical protein n=1 Tax=Pseudanabaena sp. PCC 6802 TaxID=118173 RepID=UPI000348A458|nr:hypothetical protein [Pseudanabaena sp. PCC 6802]